MYFYQVGGSQAFTKTSLFWYVGWDKHYLALGALVTGI